MNDLEFKAEFQSWVNAFWQGKDELIHHLAGKPDRSFQGI
jgi:hypothetical protein